MGNIGEFTFKHRLFLRTYRWRRIDPVPCTPLSRPLRECRIAIVSSAGFVLPGQKPFDTEMRGGDPSFREIPADTDVSSLVDMHRSETFDHADMRDDPNLVFPIDRMRELAERGRIGSVSRRHLSFMGGITAPGRLVKYTAPEAARQLVSDAIDAALLIPVWPLCNQAVGLVGAELERQGIASVAIQLLREVAEKVRPPRALLVPFRHGHPLDRPGDPERQHAVIEAALQVLEDPAFEPPALVEFAPVSHRLL